MIEIQLHRLPDFCLSANRTGTHWAVRAKAKEEYSQFIALCLDEQGLQRSHFILPVLEVELIYPVKRKRDQDNAVSLMKALTDTLKRLGIIDEDNAEVLVWRGMPTITIEKGCTPHAVVTIWEKEELAEILR